MSIEDTDRQSAVATLTTVRDYLDSALDDYRDATNALMDKVLSLRPSGFLSVKQIADAVGRDRGYVDTLWSKSGSTVKGRQTRMDVAARESEVNQPLQVAAAIAELQMLASRAASTKKSVSIRRTARDCAVVKVYASKLLGPSEIARHAGIDRNHVLRLCRRAGVPPMHRTGVKNQYTKQQDSSVAS
jgi:hypothetical protein